MSNNKEWSMDSSFNPFNTFKILKHIDHWKKIDMVNKYVPVPIGVTIDPINACNYRCEGCNARRVLDSKEEISYSHMIELPTFLKNWGVKAVTLAGGGEPLLSDSVSPFINMCGVEGLPVGLITNGFCIDRHIPSITKCSWIGVSVDAGTPLTYAKVKNTDEVNFAIVIDNICELTRRGVDVTFKFLINRHNIADIYKAIKLAKDCGCKRIHIRPLGTAWFDEKRPIFNEQEVDVALENIVEGRREFESDNFKVFGITHKFGNNWKVSNNFEKCWATFMYLVIEPGIRLSTCCDNRGNDKVMLANAINNLDDIARVWGSPRHFEIFEKINVMQCPRCTFSLHSQCYENCILEDKMKFDFI